MKETKRSFGQKIKESALRLFFGPETTGVVQYALRDKFDHSVWHVLVITPEGEEKHFMCQDESMLIQTQGGLKIVGEKFSDQIGDSFYVRTRGTGMIILPWSKVERDPFNLKPVKKKKYT